MTSELQQTRYDQLIRRVGGIIGPGSKVSEALSELFPVISVEDLPAELMMLAGWKMAMGGSELAATAAEVSKIQLFNPVGSGQLVVIERINAGPATTVDIRMAFTNTALVDESANDRFRDTRLGTATIPTASTRTDSSATGVAGQFIQRTLGNTTIVVESTKGVAVLAPGSGLTIGPDSTNIALVASFLWRERVAESSELLFP